MPETKPCCGGKHNHAVAMELNQVTIPLVDYDASVRFYTLLGLRQIVASPPRYARFETPGGTTLSIHACDQATACPGVMIYFEVDDVDAKVAELSTQGIAIIAAATDQPWLWREARFEDPAGNVICVYHAGHNRRFPPWRIGNDGSP